MYIRKCINILGIMTFTLGMTACAKSTNREGAINPQQPGIVEEDRAPIDSNCKENSADCDSKATESSLKYWSTNCTVLARTMYPMIW